MEIIILMLYLRKVMSYFQVGFRKAQYMWSVVGHYYFNLLVFVVQKGRTLVPMN